MTFTSLTFLIFFPMVFLLHWLGRSRHWQNTILVLASYFFYGWWDYRFCALMLASSLIDYGIGLYLHSANSDFKRKASLTLSVVCNLGLLGFFKYCNFFAENLEKLLGELGWTVPDFISGIILPVGISFYTFQTLSYTIDIYRGKLKPTRNIFDYLAFVSFFPQLVAGPVERATNLIPQFSKPRLFDYSEAVAGCQLILWGFLKKLVVADRLASVVDAAYLNPAETPGTVLLIATVFFAFQIYCDFSAYSDIAIGTAKLFNIQLMRNFNYPYFSQSISEFWRRWHISLSTWFRDYVFIPLGGSRTSKLRTNLNLMTTFVLSGLWHGAAWQFIVWGGINGLALVGEKKIDSLLPAADIKSRSTNPFVAAVRIGMTFSIICLGWVFFRANHLNEALSIVYKIAMIPICEFHSSIFKQTLEFHDRIEAGLLILLGFASIEWFGQHRIHPLQATSSWSLPARWMAYTAVIWLTARFMLTLRINPFIYFTF